MRMAEELDNSSARRACLALVIADDLTGACDAGVQFAHAGLRSIVELSSVEDAPNPIAPPDADVRILNSRSRHQTPDAAAEEVKRLTRRAAPDARAICFKKVDSTLRGNGVSESRAMMRAAGLDCAVLAPALPSQGRTVAGGILRVRDCTGTSMYDARALLAQQGLDSVAQLSACGASPPEKIA
jgi:D-threonate/D-erythronate kinase